MTHNFSEQQMDLVKLKSRGVSCDMSPDAIMRRLDIVDELRELAKDLQNSKRLGSIKETPGLMTPSEWTTKN